ncbi:hypothetical protein B5Z81_25005 [Salmonella enterica subsp. enterica serovar Typhimurium]|nr:hypothetical protein B5Z81_25005 [Salmonella enterica subsp. enterica serovar Typhimurium]
MGLALTGRCSPQSHRYLCSWGLTPLPPLSNSNYFGYIFPPVTSLSMLLGTHSLAAFKQLELFWLYIPL